MALTTKIKSLINIARKEKKQVFATTHSKECIEAYSLALKELELEDSGRIIRLAETKKGIKSYTMHFDEFENAMKSESEIR